MIVPIRCFTCGALIGDAYYKFARRVKTGENAEEVLNSLGLKRYCCRRMILANVDIIDQILPYYEAIQRRRSEYASDQG